MTLTVREITAADHLALVAARGSASFLQTPAWGAVKKEWRSSSIGWCDGDGKVVGAGLVLYRKVPKLDRYLAYLPEGPVLDWSALASRATCAPTSTRCWPTSSPRALSVCAWVPWWSPGAGTPRRSRPR